MIRPIMGAYNASGTQADRAAFYLSRERSQGHESSRRTHELSQRNFNNMNENQEALDAIRLFTNSPVIDFKTACGRVGARTIAGAGAGAGIGSVIVLGPGTAIGAGIGTVVGFVSGIFSLPRQW